MAYPGSIYSYSTLTDGIDDVLASHQNTPNAELIAIETELGTNPKTIDDTVAPGSPTSVANLLDMFGNIVKTISGSTTWQNAAAAAIMKSIGTAKGKMIGFSAASTPVAISSATADGLVLTSGSTETAGVKWTAASGSGAVPHSPGGRLTLTTGVPVMTADTTGNTSIYYTPYLFDLVPIYNGTVWTETTFTELTNTTTDNTKNPAAVGTNSNYDLFVWSDSGTLRLGRGPAWTSDTARGTGAGTTELVRVNGILLNANSITNGPAAQRGTYVGTVRSNGSSTIDWLTTPAVASKGTNANFHVWNMYNRVVIGGMSRDSDNTWTYNSTTIRAANAGNVRGTFINGINEDAYEATYVASVNGGASGDAVIGIGLDATNAYVGLRQYGFTGASNYSAAVGTYKGLIGLGYHYLAACESQLTTASAATFIGDQNGPTQVQNGLVLFGRM